MKSEVLVALMISLFLAVPPYVFGALDTMEFIIALVYGFVAAALAIVLLPMMTVLQNNRNDGRDARHYDVQQ